MWTDRGVMENSDSISGLRSELVDINFAGGTDFKLTSIPNHNDLTVAVASQIRFRVNEWPDTEEQGGLADCPLRMKDEP